jgi:hypothetical protein
MAPTPEPLDEFEAAALRRTLRELGLLGLYAEVAADFAKRGPLALEELPGTGSFDATDLFDAAYYSIVMTKSGHA